MTIVEHENLLPHNVEAEAGVLGSILIDPITVMAQLADVLEPEDFYIEAHRTIYEAALALNDEGKPAELLLLCDELTRRGKYEEVGGASYVGSLANQVPHAQNARHYATIVRREKTKRLLIGAAGTIAGVAYSEADADAALEQAYKAIDEISQRRMAEQDVVSFGQALRETLEEIHELAYGERTTLKTGFADLDEHTGGFLPGELIYLCARAKVGKSALIAAIALNVAKQLVAAGNGGAVLWTTLEMGRRQVVKRLIAMQARLNTHYLRTGFRRPDGTVDEDRYAYMHNVVDDRFTSLKDAIQLRDYPTSPKALERLINRVAAQHGGCPLVIVDYLSLMDSDDENSRASIYQRVTDLSRAMKTVAQQCRTTVLCLVQLNRAAVGRADHRPWLTDMRDSGCLTGDTRIYLPDEGVYRRIDALIGQTGLRVLALDPATWKLVPRPVSNAFSTGLKVVYRLKTRLGRTIQATANHPFLTIEGWKRLDQLAANERIAIPRELVGPQADTMTRAELALLGHLIGDGCTLPSHAMQYTTADADLAEYVAQLCKQVFGDAIQPKIVRDRTWYQVYFTMNGRLPRRPAPTAVAWLEEMGAFGHRSYDKRIPDKVYRQSAEGIAWFLRHLWVTDGCACMRADGARAAIHYATSSAGLAADVQSLLLRIGIPARVQRSPQVGKGRDQYLVVVSGGSDQRRFVEIVGTVGQRKQRMLDAVAASLAERRANTNRDVLPRDVWRLFAFPALVSGETTHRQLHAALGVVYNGSARYRNHLSRAHAQRLAEVIGSAELSLLAQSDVYWDEITSITCAGEEEVYDLTVEGLHNFVAENILVHNSLEQDPDWVFGLHRPGYYEPQRTRDDMTGEVTLFGHFAELIALAARDGVADDVTIPLHYDGAYTSFTNWPRNWHWPDDSTRPATAHLRPVSGEGNRDGEGEAAAEPKPEPEPEQTQAWWAEQS